MLSVVAVGLFALVGWSNACFNVKIEANGGSISPVLQGGRYPANVDCTYTITQFEPYGLMFQFEKMDLEVDDIIRPCKADMYTCTKQCDENDWVAIKESPSGIEVTRRCDQNVPDFIYRTPGAASVWFRTDGNIQRTGFILNFQVDPDTAPCTTTTTLSGKASGTISSYKRAIDGKYRANEDCRWKVTVPSNYNAIKFSFKKMEVEGSCGAGDSTCSCPKDFVAIHDGDTDGAPIITTRCGFSAPIMNSTLATSASPVAFIRFKTDDKVQYPGWQLVYEGCVAPCETTTAPTTTPTTTSRPNIAWPRNEALLGFWPLDRKFRLNDASSNAKDCDSDCKGAVSDSFGGPFGEIATSHQPGGENQPILTAKGVLKLTKSFSVSLFIRIPANAEGGILSFMNDADEQVFAIEAISSIEGDSTRPKLLMRGSASNSIGVFGPYDVIQPDSWTFITAVYDETQDTLAIYGKYGQLYYGAFKKMLQENKGQAQKLRIGVTTKESASFYLAQSAAVSCVSVYSTALSAEDITPIHEACRVAHGVAPCGAPRIPVPVAPTTSSGTPSYGQFPYIASIRQVGPTLNHICSASIIDRFHLLTAASCFDLNRPYDYTVYVGEHNLVLTEPHEFKHSINKFITEDFHNTTFNNYVLVELQTPIEMSNYYVNTICLPQPSDIIKDSPSYFFGWGANGRPSGASTTLPRYVKGSAVNCGSSWDGSTDPALITCFESEEASRNNVPCTGDEGGPLLALGNSMNSQNSRMIPVGVYNTRIYENGACSSQAPSLLPALHLTISQAR